MVENIRQALVTSQLQGTEEARESGSPAAPSADMGSGPSGTVRIRISGQKRNSRDTTIQPQPALDSISSEYEVLGVIGEGGMGTVYLARDRRLGRYVAIKRLNRNWLASPPMKERFFREARAIASLTHIHIVHLYALGEDAGGPYIVMEYVPGPGEPPAEDRPPIPHTLEDRVKREGPMALDEALDLLIKVCRAIECAHGCGVIHRDLKPSNVLFDASYEPKLVDFGLARFTSGPASALTEPGERMLSLGYGPPEQEVDASLADERADVYGLGGLLYFALTGKNPRFFRESDVPEVLRLPIVKALDTDKHRRWETVKQFATAMEMIRHPEEIGVSTTKVTWRCKWCESINPVSIRYCGRCGWDGGEACPECGSQTRFGIQFCGVCGSDARTYESVLALLNAMQKHMTEKAFTLVVNQEKRIAGFQPSGSNGQKLIEQVHTLSRRAQEALQQRDELASEIPREFKKGHYEKVQDYIQQYEAVSTDHAFEDVLRQLPMRIAERDISTVRFAMDNGEWRSAARTCRRLLEADLPMRDEVKRLLRKIEKRIQVRKMALATATVIGACLLYLLSAAPLYPAFDGPAGAARHRTVFSPVYLLHQTPLLKEPLETYAQWFGSSAMFAEP
jgi:serine/threonine protein kinase